MMTMIGWVFGSGTLRGGIGTAGKRQTWTVPRSESRVALSRHTALARHNRVCWIPSRRGEGLMGVSRDRAGLRRG